MESIYNYNVPRRGERRTFFRLSAFFISVVFLSIGATLLTSQPLASTGAASPAQLRLLQSDANHVVLELETPDYDARKQSIGNATYVALSVPGLGHVGQAGKPQLPIKGTMIGIPPDAQLALGILADETRSDSLAYPPLPAPTTQVQFDPAQMLPRQVGTLFAPEAAIYSSNQFYPADSAYIASVGNWRSQRYAVIEFHPLQYNPATHQLILHRRLRVEITFSYPRGQTRAALGSALSEGPFDQVLQQALVNYASAKNWRAKNTPANLSAPKGSTAQTSGPWYKIAVNADGICQITCAQLQAAGIALGSLDLNTLKIYKQGNELAINVVGQCSGVGSGYIELFGQAARTKYTDTNIYWLTYGGAAGKRMAQRSGDGTGSPLTIFTDTIHLEQDRMYYSYLPWAEDADHWFWHYVPDSRDGDGNGDPNSVDYTFQLASLATGSYSATLKTSLVGFYTGNRRTQIYVNGNLMDDTTWSGRVERNATISFSQTYLKIGTNTIRVREVPASGDYVFVNYFDISYVSTFTATNDTLRFRNASNGVWQYQMAGFSDPAVETFDITDPLNVTRIVNTTAMSASSTFTRQFADAIASPREYIALTPARRITPVSITRDTPSALRSPSNGADYIMIAYGGFIPNIQPLASYRASQGLRVKVVDVQDVYDEFNDGLMDAQAIRDFLAYAYANWQPPAPSFVLLVGDGNFDFKNNMGTNEPNFIPPYLRFVDFWLGEAASDNRLVTFNPDNTLPSLAIGRLPADSAADVDAMVAKILNYEQRPSTGNWRSKIDFVADNPDSAGDFWNYSDLIANDPRYMPATLSVDRIYYNNPPYTTAASARDAIVSTVNDGRLIVNYVGHGGITAWASESLFNVTNLNTLTNDKLPVMLSMSCYVGYFHYPGLPGLAESSVRLANRGMLASWAATGLGMAAGQDYLDRGFFEAVIQRKVRQLGPATVFSKTSLWLSTGGAFPDLIDTFLLFGDPASRLAGLPDTVIYLPFISK